MSRRAWNLIGFVILIALVVAIVTLTGGLHDPADPGYWYR